MQNFLADHYNWLRAAHIIAVITWMAGMLYLPRLFVYHCETPPGTEGSERFKVMERRLMAAIMRPAAAASLLSGVLLFIAGGFEFLQVWVLGKLAAVFLLCVYHGALEAYLQRFARDERVRDARFFRILNEVPTLLLIVIVVFIVIKPFQ